MSLFGTVSAGNDLGMKNRIINGAMVISQRNGTSTVATPTDGQYVLDRFATFTNGGGVYSVGQSTTAPAGFNNSMVCTVTTVDSSIAATDYYLITQIIEGLNVADLGFGTANAQTVTVSFWVRSSITGTFGFGLRQGSGTRSYVATYTISSANTWEQKTITIAGDTSGTWDTTNGPGMIATWDLGSGSNRNGTANTWNAGNYWRTSGCVNWIANSGATFYITGVQLEKGSTATSFDYRPYGTELQLCQRYFEKSFDDGTAPQNGTSTHYTRNGLWCGYSDNSNDAAIIVFKVTKRTTPSMSSYGNSSGYWFANGGFGPNAAAFSTVGTTGSVIRQQSVGGLSVTNGHWTASAEL
jgi:predicted secreted protein